MTIFQHESYISPTSLCHFATSCLNYYFNPTRSALPSAGSFQRSRFNHTLKNIYTKRGRQSQKENPRKNTASLIKIQIFPRTHTTARAIDLTHTSVAAFARHLSIDRKRSILICHKSFKKKQIKHASFKFNLFHRFFLLLHNLNKLTQMFVCVFCFCFEKDVGVLFFLFMTLTPFSLLPFSVTHLMSNIDSF
uniref:(northern house mosquito) hypothetical protein n=1 Tax=Culex pipiens TaxID=7175 RepID=A0A8D8FYQ4_CULPI